MLLPSLLSFLLGFKLPNLAAVDRPVLRNFSATPSVTDKHKYIETIKKWIVNIKLVILGTCVFHWHTVYTCISLELVIDDLHESSLCIVWPKLYTDISCQHKCITSKCYKIALRLFLLFKT